MDTHFRGNTRRETQFGDHHVEDTVPERQPVHLSRLDMHPFEHPIRPQPVLGAIQKGGVVFDPRAQHVVLAHEVFQCDRQSRWNNKDLIALLHTREKGDLTANVDATGREQRSAAQVDQVEHGRNFHVGAGPTMGVGGHDGS